MKNYSSYNKNGIRYIIYPVDGKWNLYQVSWAGANILVSSHDSQPEAVSAL